MTELYNESKLNYMGNKVAVRNLISICNSYEKIYSSMGAQLVLATNSVESWYATWNATLSDSDISLNGTNTEHRQCLQELSLILDVLYLNTNSILTTSFTPVSMTKITKNFDICDNIIIDDVSHNGNINTTEFSANYYRTLKLKHLVGRLNNIGIGFNNNIPFDYISDISSNTNRYINGRYSYRIGTFGTEIIQIDLWNEAESRSTLISELFNNIAITDTKGYIDFGTTHVIYINLIKSLQCLKEQINFSTAILQDSRSTYQALL